MLSTPPGLRGATVYADGRKVGVVDDSDLTYFRFWRPKSELRVEQRGFRPIVKVLRQDGENYPLIEPNEVVRSVVGAMRGGDKSQPR
jgi:hypothetical protein